MLIILQKKSYQQLTYFLLSYNVFDTFRSGFGPNHSTETALTNDIRMNTNAGEGNTTLLVQCSSLFSGFLPLRE